MSREKVLLQAAFAVPELHELASMVCVIMNIDDCLQRAEDALEAPPTTENGELEYVEKQIDLAKTHLRLLQSKFAGVMREIREAFGHRYDPHHKGV